MKLHFRKPMVALALCACALTTLVDQPAHAADGAAPNSNAPVVFNAPQNARAGDIVGLQGEHFGVAPVVSLLRAGEAPEPLPLVNQFGDGWLSVRLPPTATGALVVQVDNGQATSAPVLLNAARPLHLDTLQIVPAGAFRLFGRNLLLPGYQPVVTVNGLLAQLNLQASSEQMLIVTAPAGLRPTAKALVTVDNGNGSGAQVLDRPIEVVAATGTDPFGLGVGWAGAFAPIANRVLRAEAEARAAGKPLCNGMADDTATLQAGIDKLAAAGGGILQLPAGRCRLAGSIRLQSRVVLQGAGKDDTVLAYEASYPVFGKSLDLTGLRNLTLANQRPGIESPLMQDNRRSYVQNVRFLLGGGIHMYLSGNTNFVVTGSDFEQPRNAGGHGPYTLGGCAALVFTSNSTTFADGGTNFSRVHDAYIADNRFTRDARGNQNSTVVTHSLAMDFAHRIAIVHNTFDVLGGPIVNKMRNDGETLLTEGGGARRTEGLGTVAQATALTLTDPAASLDVAQFEGATLPENYGMAIVSGKGAGQTRRVVGYQASTFTMDRAWDVVPDASSHYARFVWGLEKALIQNNTLRQNPRGIWLYQTAVREVDIVGNQIEEGGGIYLRTAQNTPDRLFTPMYGVRIANNSISNSTGEWRSYLSTLFVRMDEPAFGVATTGVEIRANTLRANTPNLSQPQEESGAAEAIVVRMLTEGPTQALSKDQTRLLGTVIQDNRCTGCNMGVIVREGAKGTVQEGNTP